MQGRRNRGCRGCPTKILSTIEVKHFSSKRPCPRHQIFKASYGPALLLQPKPRPYVTPGECVLRIKNFNLSSFLTPNNPNLCIYVLFFFLLIPNVRQFYYYTLAAKTRLYSSVQYTSTRGEWKQHTSRVVNQYVVSLILLTVIQLPPCPPSFPPANCICKNTFVRCSPCFHSNEVRAARWWFI